MICKMKLSLRIMIRVIVLNCSKFHVTSKGSSSIAVYLIVTNNSVFPLPVTLLVLAFSCY